MLMDHPAAVEADNDGVVRERLRRIKAALEAAVAPPAPGDDDEAEEEEEEVEEKVALLRQLVPGGEGMEVDGLLEETADYIAALKAQVGVMRALACVLSGAGLDAMLPAAEKKADGHVDN